MNESRPVKLMRIGAAQVIEVPPAFEMPGDKATMRKEGDTLVIEAERKKSSLKEWLATLEPIHEEWPEIPDLPADPVDL
jgi:antitoxin VapB